MSGRVLGAAVGLMLATVLGVYGVTGVQRIREMRREIDAAEAEIAQLRGASQKLTETIDSLRNDPAYIEKLAREERGFVREGDTVLKFPSKAR